MEQVRKEDVDSNIELRSEEVREILGRTPSYVVRWGISIIFGIVVLLLIGSIFFYYPDVIEAQVKITTEHPAVWITAYNSGVLKELYVNDKENVNEGDILAVIENPANVKDMMIVKTFLDSISPFFYEYNPSLLVLPSRNLQLGEIQDFYTKFYSECEDFIHFRRQLSHEKKIMALLEKLNSKWKYLEILKKQQKLQQDATNISQVNFDRSAMLYKKDVIPLVDYEAANKELLTEKQDLEQINLNIYATTIQIGELKQEIEELNLKYEDDFLTFKHNLRSDYEILLSKIALWEHQYVLRAKTEGKITFISIWSKNQQITAGSNIFAIIANKPGKIIGKAEIPTEGSGKVRKGQRANIKLDSYPYMEYGMISGKVSSISLISAPRTLQDVNNYYMVELNIPEELKTTYGRQIEFTGELTGTVEITTDNMSLFMRLLTPFKYFFKQNQK